MFRRYTRRHTQIAVVALLALAVSVVAQLSGCARLAKSESAPAPAAPIELDISAATSLRAALAKIAPGFEKANNVKLVINFGASGVLQKQIEGGAPCDVFASASPTQIDALTKLGLTSADATATFASNDLVIVVPTDNPAGITTPADLAGATRLVTGNPDTAPHGTKAREYLEALGTWNALEPKFVFAENAAQTVDYVSRGEVDAGLVFSSEVIDVDTVKVAYTVPVDEIETVRYVAAPIMASPQLALAERFVAYLLTPEAQAVLSAGGFRPAPPPATTPTP